MHTAISYIARLSWALAKSQSGKEGRAFRNIGKKYIYIPDCKISYASFVLYFHLLLLRSFIRIRSFFFISWSLLSPRTADISGRRFSPSGGREATTGNASAVRGLVLALKIEEWRNTCEDSDTQSN